MKWIGITGNLGSGKSTVAALLRAEGYVVLDADQLARQALGPGSEVLPPIKARFGQEVFDADGILDRKALGRRVFNSKEDLLWLESQIHPVIQKQVQSQRQELTRNGTKMAFYDVPLLFEKNLQGQFDEVIVVSSALDALKDRVAKRDGLSQRDIESRLNNQIPLHEKEAMADHVLFNNGSLKDLEAAVKALILKLS